MTGQTIPALLLDHVEVATAAAGCGGQMFDRNKIVRLDPDHPGFRDQEYRARRNRIAQMAEEYRPGTPIPDAPYTPQEHEVWRIIYEALEPAHRKHVCAECLESVQYLQLPRKRIPQLREVTEKVEAVSGFRLEPVAGLVEPRVFLESLANNVFLSTQYIRHHSAPFYTPEPDVAHEIIGHAATLANERLAELNRLVGFAVGRNRSTEAVLRLSRVYWFTLEFGVLREAGKVKAYGSGLLSSAAELEAMHKAELRPFDLEAASRTDYDPTNYQPVLFCADSFEAMYGMLKDFLLHW